MNEKVFFLQLDTYYRRHHDAGLLIGSTSTAGGSAAGNMRWGTSLETVPKPGRIILPRQSASLPSLRLPFRVTESHSNNNNNSMMGNYNTGHNNKFDGASGRNNLADSRKSDNADVGSGVSSFLSVEEAQAESSDNESAVALAEKEPGRTREEAKKGTGEGEEDSSSSPETLTDYGAAGDTTDAYTLEPLYPQRPPPATRVINIQVRFDFHVAIYSMCVCAFIPTRRLLVFVAVAAACTG